MREAIDGFSSRTLRHGEALHLVLEGDASMTAADAIGQALEEVHDAAQRDPTSLVVVDVRSLEFMNSSCFKKFVAWLARVQDSSKAGQYLIRFLSDPKMHWQRRSLHVLQCFAPDLVSIET